MGLLFLLWWLRYESEIVSITKSNSRNNMIRVDYLNCLWCFCIIIARNNSTNKNRGISSAIG